MADVNIILSAFSGNVVGSQTKSSRVKRHPLAQRKIDLTKSQTNNLMNTCTYVAAKVKTNAIKGNPVDQSSFKSFSGLIHEYEFCKTVP